MVLTYTDYCYYTKQNPEKEEPNGFEECQDMALNIFFDGMAQTQLLPRSFYIFNHLKAEYRDQFAKALCAQITFVHEHGQDLYSDQVSMLQTVATVNYNASGIQLGTLNKLGNQPCPVALMHLKAMGGNYMSTDGLYELEQFYNKNAIEIVDHGASYISGQQTGKVNTKIIPQAQTLNIKKGSAEVILENNILTIKPKGKGLITIEIVDTLYPEIRTIKSYYVEE